MSGLISILIALVVIGVVVYLINHYLPLDPPFKLVINVVIVLALIIWLLKYSGLVSL